MDEITRIFIDTSKTVFQLHGVNAAEAVVLKRHTGKDQRAAPPIGGAMLTPSPPSSSHWPTGEVRPNSARGANTASKTRAGVAKKLRLTKNAAGEVANGGNFRPFPFKSRRVQASIWGMSDESDCTQFGNPDSAKTGHALAAAVVLGERALRL